MPDFEDLKEAVSDFAHEKPFLLTVIAIIVLLFFSGLIILMIQTTPAKKLDYQQPEPFVQDSPVLIPDSPDIEKEYYSSRITENQWSKEEVNRWFTYPDEDSMSELEKANDRIIKDITEAAP
ncbi:hypothetical protein [Treponema sp.]|uniref:hypothetical protein n=1 Tax=Treponema sp. TaxID=166 RepID=UPI00388EEBB7